LVFTTVWRGRTPNELVPTSSASAASGEASVRSRVGLATTSLESKDYRRALAYAQDVLQAAPNDPDARRIRDAAGSMLRRFDEQIARARGLLAAGDASGATTALNAARAIDPDAPAVGELWARAVDQLKTQADAARREAQQARATPPARGNSGNTIQRQSPEPVRIDPPRISAPEPQRAAPRRAPAPEPPSSPAIGAAPPPSRSAIPPEAAAPPPVQAVQPPPKPAEPQVEHREPPPPSRPVETDEAAIRRLVASYARA